jgi:hypothetical protein
LTYARFSHPDSIYLMMMMMDDDDDGNDILEVETVARLLV